MTLVIFTLMRSRHPRICVVLKSRVEFGRAAIRVADLVPLEVVFVVLGLHSQETLNPSWNSCLLQVDTNTLANWYLPRQQWCAVLRLHVEFFDILIVEELKPLLASDLHESTRLGSWDVLSIEI